MTLHPLLSFVCEEEQNLSIMLSTIFTCKYKTKNEWSQKSVYIKKYFLFWETEIMYISVRLRHYNQSPSQTFLSVIQMI